jgi:hypothetical protein
MMMNAGLVVVRIMYSRRRFWRSLLRYLDEQGVVDGLASGIVGIQGPAHVLFGAQCPVCRL